MFWMTHLRVHLTQRVCFLLFVRLQGHDGRELLQLEICHEIRRKWILCFPSIPDVHLRAKHKPQHGEAHTHTHTGRAK